LQSPLSNYIFVKNIETGMDLKSLELELLKLSSKERAIVTYKLLESLEGEEVISKIYG